MPMQEEESYEGTPIQTRCAFCLNEVDRDDPTNYYEVVSWVHGPKLDGPVLREKTGRVGHEECIKKMKEGQAPDQEALL